MNMIHTLKCQCAESNTLTANYEEKFKILLRNHKEEIKQERVTCAAVVKGLEDQLLRRKDEYNKLYLEMKDQRSQLAAVIDKNTITNQFEEDVDMVRKLQKMLKEANNQISVLSEEKEVLTSQGVLLLFIVVRRT